MIPFCLTSVSSTTNAGELSRAIITLISYQTYYHGNLLLVSLDQVKQYVEI